MRLSYYENFKSLEDYQELVRISQRVFELSIERAEKYEDLTKEEKEIIPREIYDKIIKHESNF